MALVVNGFIGNTFVEQGERGEAIFYLETRKSSPLEYTNDISKIAEAKLMAMPEVETVIANVGASEGGLVAGNLPSYRAELRVVLKKNLIKDKDFIEKAKVLLCAIPGANITNTVIDLRGGPTERPVQIIVSSDNIDTVKFYSNKLKDLLINLSGTSKVRSSFDDGVSEIKVEIDREKMISYGLDVANVGATMANAFHGDDGDDDGSKYNKDGSEYNIIVQLNKFDRRNPDDVAKLSFANNKGSLIELSQFAKLTPSIGSSKLERTNRLPSGLIEAYLIGKQIGDVGSEIDKLISNAKFPNTVKVTWIGEYANQQESGGVIGGAFGISFLLMYFLMAILYNNFTQPLIVLFAIPMSFIGAFLALALAKSSLSVFTLMGLIVMMGLVCKNSILIVDFANKERKDGKSTMDALLAAGKERLRPILMTTIAMVLGMLPIAIADGAGAEWKNGLGWCLVGGLTSSMCLTIFIVPAVYLVFETIKLRRSNRKQLKESYRLTL